MSLAIDILNLSKEYKVKNRNLPKKALSSVNLQIKKGSIFGLLGPNGAGKSTLINIISGLILKTSGNVKVMGLDIELNPKSIKLLVGVVPQEIVIDPFFNVTEALTIYSGYYGIKESKTRIKHLINVLGLTDKIDSMPRMLSGGMRRRLLIAKALIHDPEIILLDEPSAGVDVELRSHLWAYIKNLSLMGKTIILTTHYIEEAETLCDQLAIMKDGKIILEGEKNKLLGKLSQKNMIVKINSSVTDELIKIYNKDNIFVQKKSNNEILFIYDPSKSSIDSILTKLFSIGIGINDISTKQSSLEDLLRSLIENK